MRRQQAGRCRPSRRSYVAIPGSFVCLAAILDAWSRKVVGYAISRSMDARIAVAALKTAIRTRAPPQGCIHHSDHGLQLALQSVWCVPSLMAGAHRQQPRPVADNISSIDQDDDVVSNSVEQRDRQFVRIVPAAILNPVWLTWMIMQRLNPAPRQALRANANYACRPHGTHLTRKRLDWTERFGAIARACATLPDGIIDGEIVALNGDGAPDFAALQAAIGEGATDQLVFFAFDLFTLAERTYGRLN